MKKIIGKKIVSDANYMKLPRKIIERDANILQNQTI